MKKANCRSCKKEIVWVITEQGKNMPVDFHSYKSQLAKYKDGKLLYDPNLHVSHFSSCSEAKRWRKKRK